MSSISNLYVKNRNSSNYLTHKINRNWLSNEDCTIFVMQLKPLLLFTTVVTNPNFRDKNKLFDSFEKKKRFGCVMINNILCFLQWIPCTNSMKKMNRDNNSYTFLAEQPFEEYYFISCKGESRFGAASNVPKSINY